MRYSLRTLRGQLTRLAFTIGGIGLCVVLILFLVSVYQGVSAGSVEYIRKNPVDLWVLQGNATNILRGSSILLMGHGTVLREIEGVESASPVLFLLATIKKENLSSTVYLTGYDLEQGIGGPPEIISGRQVKGMHEIVVDQSFARKFHLRVGDSVSIQDFQAEIVGLSAGTNMFVIQYAFVSLNQAQSLVGYPSLVTCYLLRLHEGANPDQVTQLIREELPGVEVYEHDQFVRNNVREMESGFLPLLYTIAAIGAVVLTVILSLILTINILERRKDFAMMKALGSPKGFLPRLIIEQSLAIATAGCAFAFVLFNPLVWFIETISPEICTKSTLPQFAGVLACVWIMSLLSGWIAVRRLRTVYPLEVFQ